jgi:oligopeptide transport system ATP-binding protein
MGEVLYEGQNVLRMGGTELQQMRRHMQIVFQDPYSSLNPRLTIRQALAEPCLVHGLCSPREVRGRVDELLGMVGLSSPDVADRLPHELSGGQRQRVGLARALAVEPTFIVADEPVSALDVSIQAQVINLLVDLQERLHLTLLFITHDLRLVRYVSHRVVVMYLGRVVEMAPTETLFARAAHPYTRALLAAAPTMDPRKRKTTPAIGGEPPSPINRPSGCPFRTRCPLATERCVVEDPQLRAWAEGHTVACHNV